MTAPLEKSSNVAPLAGAGLESASSRTSAIAVLPWAPRVKKPDAKGVTPPASRTMSHPAERVPRASLQADEFGGRHPSLKEQA